MNSIRIQVSRTFKAVALAMIVFSFVVQLAALALNAGYGQQQGLADSQGNRVGFNNPLTHEHIGMLFRRGLEWDTIRAVGINPLEASILIAHGLAVLLLFFRRINWFLISVFALTQVIPLYLGAFGLTLLVQLPGHAWTGESIVEGSLSIIAASGVWFLVSLLLFVWLAGRNWLRALLQRKQIRVPSVQFRG